MFALDLYKISLGSLDENSQMQSSHDLCGYELVLREDLDEHVLPDVFGLATKWHAEWSLALLCAED